MVSLTLAARGSLPLVIVNPFANNSRSNRKQVSEALISTIPEKEFPSIKMNSFLLIINLTGLDFI